MQSLETSRQGMTVVAEGEGQISADIVFVHGLNGDAIQTWSKDGICWPRDLLPLDSKDVRILTWGYDSKVASLSSFTSQDIAFGHCENLLFDLDIVRRGLTRPRPIVFVAHSLGGLVIKQNQPDARLGAIIELTVGVVFIATPHNGSGAAPLSTLVANAADLAWRLPNEKWINNLRTDSDALEAQRRSFASVSRFLSIRCVYEELPTMGYLIVPEESAVMTGFSACKVGLLANHHDVCKFTESDAGYKRVSTFILDLVKDATTLSQRFYKEICQTLRYEEITTRYKEIFPAYRDTFKWIFSRQDIGYSQWLSRQNGIFWITGKPGSGKSTLMKYIFENQSSILEYFCSQDHQIPIVVAAFFFSAAGTPMQKSPAGFLRSLLFQILEKAPQILPFIFKDEYQQYWKDPEEILAQWDTERLYKTFSRISMQQDLGLRILLLVDGLDEVEGEYSHKLVLLDFLIQLSQPREMQMAHFAVCMASRDLNIFRETLIMYPQLRMQDLTFNDIKAYVASTLSENSRMLEMKTTHPKEVASFESEIISKASGVFLSVTVAVASLLKGLSDRDNITELRARLDELPPELEDLYINMLWKIDDRHKEQARSIFRIVLMSPKPLTPYQIALAEDGPDIAVEVPVRQFDDDEMHFRSRDMQDRIRSRCAGLLEINGNIDMWPSLSEDLTSSAYTVSLLHKTVRDFFGSPAGLNFLSPGSAAIVPDPAISLFSLYLRRLKITNVEKKSIGKSSVVENVSILKKAHHTTGAVQVDLLAELDSILSKLDARSEFLKDKDSPRWSGHWSSHWSESIPYFMSAEMKAEDVEAYTRIPKMKLRSDCVPLGNLDSFAVTVGLITYVRERISQGLNVNEKPGKPLLRYATEIDNAGYENGTWKGPDTRIVALLIENGAEVDAQWRDISIWSWVLYDLCEFFGFRRRLLGATCFLIHVRQLDVIREMLSVAELTDINCTAKWPSQSWRLKIGTPLDVLFDCAARLDYEERMSPRSLRQSFKESRDGFTYLIKEVQRRGGLKYEDLQEQ